jgi:hypothetical protein
VHPVLGKTLGELWRFFASTGHSMEPVVLEI